MEQLHDLESERAFLGCAFTSPETVRSYVSNVSPEDFAKPAHGKIWAVLVDLAGRNEAIDHLVVAEALKARGWLGDVGGPAYLMELDSAVPFAANAHSYAEIIRDRSARRRAVDVLRRYAIRAADLSSKPDELLGEAASELVRTGAGAYQARTLADVNREVFDRLNRIQDGEDVPVVKTGIKPWDNALGGLQPTLIVIGGRTGGGKSALAATMIRSLAESGTPVGVFSLEDAADWLSYRYIAGVSGVPNFVVRYRRKRDDEWNQIAQNVAQLAGWDERVLVDDTPNLTSGQIVARATDMVINRGAKVIVVDHLQEVEHAGEAERHELKMRKSLQDLRSFANRFQVPVVLLAQAKEGDGTKKNEPPSVFDFSDAPNAIAKISRVAIIVTTDPEAGTMDAWIVKHTNGSNRLSIALRFVKHAGLVAAPPERATPVADLFDEVERMPEEEMPE